MTAENALRVPRQPLLPSPSKLDVLRSGWQVFQNDRLTQVKWVEAFEGGLDTRPQKLGKGWLITTYLGFVFLPDSSPPRYLKRVNSELLSLKWEAVQFAPPLLEVESILSEIAEKAVAIPYVDLVEHQEQAVKSFLGESRVMTLSLESRTGQRSAFSFKGGKNDFATEPTPELFLNRWRVEFGELALHVIDKVLGGEVFWSESMAELQRRGMYFASPSRTLSVAAILRDVGRRSSRVLDGPPETIDFLERATSQALSLAGFEETHALAALYLYDNPFNVTFRPPDDVSAPAEEAWSVALRDQKFARLMLAAFQPTLEGYGQVFADQSGASETGMGYIRALEDGAARP